MDALCILQARMGSTRLPGKVLASVKDGQASLLYQVNRIKKAKLNAEVIVATSDKAQDNEIVDFCVKNGIRCFRGSENDVLSRYFNCAMKYKPSIVIRATADCPLIDPETIDQVVDLLKVSGADYAANTSPHEESEYPNGADVEAMTLDALVRCHELAQESSDREHVTTLFHKFPDKFRSIRLSGEKSWKSFRYTIDYLEDLEVVQQIVGMLDRSNLQGTVKEIVAIIEQNPKLRAINAKYV